MPVKGGPAVERAMAKMLQANLNAQIDTVWAAWAANDTADGITVPKAYPASVFSGYRLELPEYPVVVVTSVGGRVEEDGMEQGGLGWQTLAHILDVAWIVQSDDVHVLDQQVQRYTVAVWETLMNNPNLDGSLVGAALTNIESYGKSEVYQHERSKLMMQGAAWRVAVRLVEST